VMEEDYLSHVVLPSVMIGFPDRSNLME
jgi:hypothetical protein